MGVSSNTTPGKDRRGAKGKTLELNFLWGTQINKRAARLNGITRLFGIAYVKKLEETNIGGC